MKKLPLCIALCMFVVSLPLASAAPEPTPAATPCLPLGETVQCVADALVGVITGTTAFVQCLLAAPPSSYPYGLTLCASHLVSAESEILA